MQDAAAWQGTAIALGSALGSGLLIGIERGWNQRAEPDGTRVAGVRTFTLLGLVGGIGGLAGSAHQIIVGGGITVAAAAMLVVAYGRALRERGDATTPVAALLTLAIGFMAGFGQAVPALGIASLTVLVLALREELHGLIARLSAEDIKALARFAAIALAVFPFLPDRPMGPYGAWNPAKLWWVVVLVTGFSFLGYAANRIVGAGRGTLVTAVIGGAYSSTAVTQSLSQRLGREDHAGAEPAGIALASAVMYLRVLVLVAVLARRLLADFAVLVAPGLAVAAIGAWLLYRRASDHAEDNTPGNPIALLPALGFLAFVAVAAVAARWAQGHFGESGIAVLLFLMGAMDVDASIVTAGSLPPETIAAPLAAAAIGGTIIANMAVKIGVTLSLAKRKGVGAAAVLAASTIALAAAIAMRWPGL